MTRTLLMIGFVGALVACRDEPVRWTDGRAVPRGAAAALARELPDADRTRGAVIADDYLHFMLEALWVGRTDGDRQLFQASYEGAVTELRAVPAEQRLGHLGQMTYLEGLFYLRRTAEGLAYRRVALELPELAEKAPPEGDDAWSFRVAPKLTLTELEGRAAQLGRELERVVSTYEPFVTPHLECEQGIAQRVVEVRALLANVSGDLSRTTGPLYRFLQSHAYPTAAATSSDLRPEGFKHECPPPP